MRKSERQTEIVRLLQQNNNHKMNINDLSKILDISAITIRRDLIAMEELGVIQRYHGAVSLNTNINMHYATNKERVQMNNSIKQQIALHASLLLVDDDTIIFMDNSTTVATMIPLLQNKNVTIITNSLDVLKLIEQYQIQGICLGGKFNHHYSMFIHPNIMHQLENYQFEYAFLGTVGLSEYGAMEVDDYTAAFKMEIVKRSKNVIILCDHTKLSPKQGFLSIPHKNITEIITDGKIELWLKNTEYHSKIRVI